MTINSVHPKIQTESLSDLSFLKEQLVRAAHKSMSERTSEVPEEQRDQVLKVLEARVNKWITSIFDLAQSNIEVNGIEATKLIKGEYYEPVDERLREQVDELHDRLQQKQVRLAKLRHQAQDMILKQPLEMNVIPTKSIVMPSLEVDFDGDSLKTRFQQVLDAETKLQELLALQTSKTTTAQQILDDIN